MQPNHNRITVNWDHLELCSFRYIRIVDISCMALLELGVKHTVQSQILISNIISTVDYIYLLLSLWVYITNMIIGYRRQTSNVIVYILLTRTTAIA